jgi:DNA polymerase-3 subunit delta
MANKTAAAKDGLGPLYGVFGEDVFLLDHALQKFMTNPVFAANQAFNRQLVSAREASPAQIIDSANTVPFLGGRRLIIVRDIDEFKSGKRADKAEDEKEDKQAAWLNKFLPYLDNPAPFTTLVFSASKLDARSRFAKALQAKGVVETVRKPSLRDLPAWLAERAKIRGKKLSLANARLLADLGDIPLMDLDQEIEKLCLYVGQDEELSASAINFMLRQGRLYSVFDLTNALLQKELGRALNALCQLLAMGMAPQEILGRITGAVRQLHTARQLLEAGAGEARLQQQLHTPPSVTGLLGQRARALDQRKIAELFKMLLQADQALKSSSGRERAILEKLLFELCGAAA